MKNTIFKNPNIEHDFRSSRDTWTLSAPEQCVLMIFVTDFYCFTKENHRFRDPGLREHLGVEKIVRVMGYAKK